MSYNGLNPELVVSDAKKAIEWYCQVFQAKLEFEHLAEDGKRMMHSLVRLPNGSTFFVVDDFREQHDGKSRVRAQEDAGLNNSCVTVTFTDGAKVFNQAVENGARVTMPFAKQFWGATYGRFADPFGHEWAIDQREEAASVPTEPEPVNGNADQQDIAPDAKTNGDTKAEAEINANGSAKHAGEDIEAPDAKKAKVDA